MGCNRTARHRTETFKLSPDSLLIAKVRDIVGLYMNPPDHAVVLCVHEKSQIQVLRRDVHLDVIAQELTSIRVKGERAESLDHD